VRESVRTWRNSRHRATCSRPSPAASSKSTRRGIAGQPVANLEDPLHPISAPDQRPRPHALAPIAPAWSPRPSFAGTYDQTWTKNRMPLPPADFNPRYNQVAPPDQIYPSHVVGGEPMGCDYRWDI
jgi:hypothetical protein